MAARWTQLDGGLVTFIATDGDIKPSEPTTPDGKIAKQIFDAIRLVGLAFDTDARTHKGNLRVELTCDNIAAAEQLQTTVESGLKLGQAALANAGRAASPAIAAEKSAQELDSDRLGAEFVSNCQVKVWQHSDGTAGILVESTATLPDFAAALTAAREKTPEHSRSAK